MYGYADRLALSAIDDIFPLDDAQRATLKPRLTALLDWHRHGELPRYVAILEKARQLLAGEPDAINAGAIEGLAAGLGSAIDRFGERLAPDAGAFLATVSPAQIDHAQAALAEADAKSWKSLDLPVEEYVRRELDDDCDRLEDYLGEVTATQRAMLERLIRDGRAREITRRKRVQDNERDFLTALRSHPGAPALTELVRQWMSTNRVNATDEARRTDATMRAQGIAVLVTLTRTLTLRQREKGAAALAELRDDLVEIAAQR